jgi:ATP-dependent DNA helicase RecQ
LSFGPAAKPILKGEQELTIAVPPPRRATRKQRIATDEAESPLFAALRAKRREIAAQAGVPPYVVFHDSTLREIAAARPRTLDDLGRIQGVGAAKLERYGEAMLAAVAAEEETADGAAA